MLSLETFAINHTANDDNKGEQRSIFTVQSCLIPHDEGVVLPERHASGLKHLLNLSRMEPSDESPTSVDFFGDIRTVKMIVTFPSLLFLRMSSRVMVKPTGNILIHFMLLWTSF